jgi:type IV pilus assembly protein PilM
MLNHFATHALGLELDSYALKGVALTCTRHNVKLEAAFELPIQPATEAEAALNVKPLYMNQARLKEAFIVTALPISEVLVRPLTIKTAKEKNIDAVIAFQAEPLLPYPVENAVLQRILLSKDKESSELTLFAVRKDHLAEEIKRWKELRVESLSSEPLNIEPELITAAPAALALFAKKFGNTREPFFALYLGYAHSFCILMDQMNGAMQLIAAQALAFKMEALVNALAADSAITPAQAYTQLNAPDFTLPPLDQHPTLKGALESLRVALTRTLFALSKQLKGRDIPAILLCGNLPAGLEELLQSAHNKTVLPLEIPKEFDMGECRLEHKELQKFALCIGEAWSAQPNIKEPLNFRQKEFHHPNPWKRLKQPVLTYLMLCVGIAVAIILYGNAESRYEEGQVRLHYLELLQAMNKPYAQFEKEFLSKSGRKELAEEPHEAAEASSLSMDELNQRLLILEKDLQSTPHIYPLQPNTPLVSDLLAWIASNPRFKAQADATDGLQMESLTYSMVKRPEPTKKQEKYQVKVELEFSSPTPKLAREFHDALIAPNEFVDPKSEIKWNSTRDRYRTSFYLKDKTAYPAP